MEFVKNAVYNKIPLICSSQLLKVIREKKLVTYLHSDQFLTERCRTALFAEAKKEMVGVFKPSCSMVTWADPPTGSRYMHTVSILILLVVSEKAWFSLWNPFCYDLEFGLHAENSNLLS